jgi:hypothetical protein
MADAASGILRLDHPQKENAAIPVPDSSMYSSEQRKMDWGIKGIFI